MMLRDLCDLYDLKRESSPDDIAPRHWCQMSVGYELVLAEEGRVVSCIPLVGEDDGRARKLVVPMAYITRSGQKPVPGFLCDDAQHVFGVGKNKFRMDLRAMHEHLAREILGGLDDSGACAYLRMLKLYSGETLPEICAAVMGPDVGPGSSEKENANLKTNMVFRLQGDSRWLHERTAIANAWNRYAVEQESRFSWGACLVLGKSAPQAKLFPQVSGLIGAQSAGAALVSCNADAFSSYGQKIAAVQSISQEAAEKAGKALNYLLKDDRHHIRMGDDYICFWTDSKEAPADEYLALWLGADETRGEDAEQRDAVQAALKQLSLGMSPLRVPSSTRYYVMGIAPYQARLAVRFYQTGTLGELEQKVALFLRDTKMDGVKPCSLKKFLEQTAVQGESRNLPKSLTTSCMRTLLDGTSFPDALEREIILRTRVDRGSRTNWDMGRRAAILRACLLRKERAGRFAGSSGTERRITVALNEENENQGYLLGRLFALLDKVQADALGNVNAGIRDRYMGAASTTPARVFPQLLKMAQHHISKSEYGARIDGLVQRVISKVDDSGFPKTLSYDDQGEFYIGFYQQREALYKRSQKSTALGAAEESE